MVRLAFAETLMRGERTSKLSREEIHFLLSTTDPEEKQNLWDAADRVREKWIGPEVHLRAVVEFSNYCQRDCLYCGLRKGNQILHRYRMSQREILETSIRAKELGFQTVVLQSGEDPFYTRERIEDLIRAIKRETEMVIALSVGERSAEDYSAWRAAGGDRYLLKFETSSPFLFHRMRPGCRLDDRMNCLKNLRNLGFEVGSGNIVGLSGQTLVDLVNDIILFQKYDFDMIAVGPFISHPQTPLGSSPNGSLDLTLSVLAITRLLTQNTHLPATTAIRILDPNGCKAALAAGANILMHDFTPPIYRRYYEIYPGKSTHSIEINEIREFLTSIGRKIGQGVGSRKELLESNRGGMVRKFKNP